MAMVGYVDSNFRREFERLAGTLGRYEKDSTGGLWTLQTGVTEMGGITLVVQPNSSKKRLNISCDGSKYCEWFRDYVSRTPELEKYVDLVC